MAYENYITEIEKDGVVYGIMDEEAREDVGNVLSAINSLTSTNSKGLSEYLYKENTYLDPSDGSEKSLNGFDLYKIPAVPYTFMYFGQTSGDQKWWGTLGHPYAFSVEYNDGTYKSCQASGLFFAYSNDEKFMFIIPDDSVKYILLCVNRDFAPYVVLEGIEKSAVSINADNVVKTNQFPQNLDSTNARTFHMYVYTDGHIISNASITTLWFKVKTGDKLRISNKVESAYGYIYNPISMGAVVITNDVPYVAPYDGIATVFTSQNNPVTVNIVQNELINVDYQQIVNAPTSPDYQGLSGVAFGTSITYRTEYLDVLKVISGINFDNQGLSSSRILTDLLAKVKAYTGYSDKAICTLEGFPNDWYGNCALGTWKDTGETTVCGCVRSALNYIMGQNANITMFLILDHCGKIYNNVDCSSTAINQSGLTQYEYYEEIAKVAESLGVPVIKVYAEGRIGENTPQYLSDNIHFTALGGEQCANYIWSKMKLLFPNVGS